jgi:hypothetical protein
MSANVDDYYSNISSDSSGGSKGDKKKLVIKKKIIVKAKKVVPIPEPVELEKTPEKTQEKTPVIESKNIENTFSKPSPKHDTPVISKPHTLNDALDRRTPKKS